MHKNSIVFSNKPHSTTILSYSLRRLARKDKSIPVPLQPAARLLQSYCSAGETGKVRKRKEEVCYQRKIHHFDCKLQNSPKSLLKLFKNFMFPIKITSFCSQLCVNFTRVKSILCLKHIGLWFQRICAPNTQKQLTDLAHPNLLSCFCI